MDHILNSSTGDLHVDNSSKTLYIKFFGEIILEEYQMILLKAEQMIMEHRLTKIIDDRSEVYGHCEDSNVWYEYEFLNDNFINIAPSLEKIALVKSEVPEGQLQTDTLEKTLMMAINSNIDLQFSAFSSLSDAENWTNKKDNVINKN